MTDVTRQPKVHSSTRQNTRTKMISRPVRAISLRP